MILAPESVVPETEVVAIKIGFVVMIGVTVVVPIPIQRKTGSDSHSPLNVWVIR